MKTTLSEKLVQSFPALGHQNFRYFWFGQCISLMGTWMQRTAQQWLVYSLTQSPFLLGLLGVFQFAPTLLFSLFAGVFVDRFPKKSILIFTQSMMMIQAMILAILVWSGEIRYWQVLALAAILGCVDTFDVPTRQSFFIELVGKDDLTGAIALNSASVNLARIIGPALSGLLMLGWGIAFCFFFNGLSFIAVLAGLLAIQVADRQIRAKQGRLLAETWAGLRYIAQDKTLTSSVLVMLAVGTFAMNTNVLVPVLAKEILHQQAGGFSLLLSAMGGGSLVAAVALSYKSQKTPRPKILFGSGVFLCLVLMSICLVNTYLPAMILLAVFGFFSMIFLSTVNSTLQLNSSDQFRGRTMSVYSLAFLGTTPIGNFFAGAVTEKFGIRFGFLACGSLTVILVAGIIFRLQKNKQ